MTGDGTPERYIIDFQRRDLLQVQRFPNAFERVRSLVLPDIQRKADAEHEAEGARSVQLEKWWMFWRDRQELFASAAALQGRRFICCSRVTKRPVFVFVDAVIRPGDALQVFVFDDDYSFGILQSSAHAQWFIAKCSKLKSDFRYTPESVFDTFPWPQSPTEAQIYAIAEAGRTLRALRAQSLQSISGGLRALYRTLDLPGKNPLKDAHTRLDAAVLAAYELNPNSDLLEQLLKLNQQVAQRIGDEQFVTAPGVPTGYTDPGRLVSADAMGRD